MGLPVFAAGFSGPSASRAPRSTVTGERCAIAVALTRTRPAEMTASTTPPPVSDRSAVAAGRQGIANARPYRSVAHGRHRHVVRLLIAAALHWIDPRDTITRAGKSNASRSR